MDEYCSQNNGNCASCSLVSYNRDCHNNPLRRCSRCGAMTRSAQYDQAFYEDLGFTPAIDTGKPHLCDDCFVGGITNA